MEIRPRYEPVPFRRLASLAGAEFVGAAASLEVGGVSVDSRRVQRGDLFVALSGEHQHGSQFAQQAAALGAVACLTDRAGLPAARSAGLATAVHADPRAAVGAVAAEIYGNPANDLLVLGVTGTNGKTTTTWLIEATLHSAGYVTGLVGTIETRVAGAPVPSVRTTPEASELQALLAVMRERGVTAAVIEVSSHALTQRRVDGFTFDLVGFTQFGSDHLDFHHDIESYFQAKLALFTPTHARAGIVCVDGEGGLRLHREATVPVRSLSTTERHADWQVETVQALDAGGYQFRLRGPSELSTTLQVGMPGRFNVSNAALAAAMLHHVGLAPEDIASGLAACPGVPGRMERVPNTRDVLAVVDYAHTPDALAAILSSLRVDCLGRLIVVVGCGGDRDVTKRAPMGRIAAELADVAILTDDNPRSEDAASIRQAMLAGSQQVPLARRATVLEVPGRGRGVEEAAKRAQPGDVVLVAGKGHESGQELADRTEPFDDRQVLAAALGEQSKERP